MLLLTMLQLLRVVGPSCSPYLSIHFLLLLLLLLLMGMMMMRRKTSILLDRKRWFSTSGTCTGLCIYRRHMHLWVVVVGIVGLMLLSICLEARRTGCENVHTRMHARMCYA